MFAISSIKQNLGQTLSLKGDQITCFVLELTHAVTIYRDKRLINADVISLKRHFKRVH